MDLFSAFIDQVAAQGWNLSQKRLLVAVSGGLDSVVLAHLCKEAGFTFAIAHCNFQLRGDESAGDAIFVKELAEKLGVPYVERDFDTKGYAAENKVSIQVAARELRYAWFEELLQENSLLHSRLPIADSRHKPHATSLLTAHHRDDAIETLLLNFFKGTGIAGLQGIPAENGAVLRPLLFATRDELQAWAESKKISWRNDSSNEETKYTRNALRHRVLPLLEELFPQVRQNLAHNLARFGELERIYRATVDLQLKKLLEWKDGEARVPVRKLLLASPLPTLLFELARPFGFTPGQTDGLLRLLQAQAGRYIDSPTHRAIRYGAWLVFTQLRQSSASLHIVQKDQQSALLDAQVLMVDELPGRPEVVPNDAATALLDARDIAYPLIVRRWKAGDYFYPLGMQKKKKLARYFIDSKVPRDQREQLWVVESHKRIIWVAGLRIDDRFKLTPATTSVLRLQLKPVSEASAAPGSQNS
ncbi:MAG: tRNA lysidine(34) synthetase TilS [Chitinophagaceae bacterium]|nr:MAG: tRNA lysidine(34) synthetase TilS [Chitinophagaceae bacterium]